MNSEKKRKTADLLTICIKAGKAVKGFDSSCEAVKNGSPCILTASDASEKTVKEAAYICGKYGAGLIRTELTKAEIGKLCGKDTAVLAVNDKGFSEAFGKIYK